MNESQVDKYAVLYRMVLGSHLCPYGLKARDLLKRRGFEVDDRHLTTQEQIDSFKSDHGVKTTPQIWIGDERIGGFDDLRAHFGVGEKNSAVSTFQPVIALFSVAALLAIALTWIVQSTPVSVQTLPWFIAISMVLLGLQKLKDIEKFATMFLNYDLLAQRWVPYGVVYPFAETGAGLLMVAGVLTWLSAPVALGIGTIGAISVLKAVYIDKRELRCACVGGDSTVPLGFVSLVENLMMVSMAVWMLWRWVAA